MKNFFKKMCENPRYRKPWDIFFKMIHPITKATILASWPALWLPFSRRLKPPGPHWKAPDPDTQLLIESPGSCATIAFIEYFKKHNPEVRLAYCCEVPATVKYCAKRNIPVILLTRNVLDFVRSGVTRYSQITRGNAFRAYSYFHRQILPIREQVVVVDFHIVRVDPKEAISRCNDFYGTAFETGDNALPETHHTQYGGERNPPA